MNFRDINKLKQGQWVVMIISNDIKRIIGVSKRVFFYDTALRYAEAIKGLGSEKVIVTTYDVYIEAITTAKKGIKNEL